MSDDAIECRIRSWVGVSMTQPGWEGRIHYDPHGDFLAAGRKALERRRLAPVAAVTEHAARLESSESP